MQDFLFSYWWLFLIALVLFLGLKTVNQGTIGVVTVFGKYQRVLKPGLRLLIPFIETIYKKISIQNRSVEMEFQAVTADQANVYFKSMLLYAVQNADEETIKRVAFKFIGERDLMQALTRTIEGTIRSFVATKRQAEILGLRKEIVEYVKEQIDHLLEDWGYHLLDLQINDITFDQAIMDSMSRVVASNNLKAAAENEGQALLITKTKGAEAEGNAIKIAAEAEREAARLRGQEEGAVTRALLVFAGQVVAEVPDPLPHRAAIPGDPRFDRDRVGQGGNHSVGEIHITRIQAAARAAGE